MIKQRLLVVVILVMSLAACGQDVLPPDLVPAAPPPPAAFQGVSLPPSPLVAESADIPPAWLIVTGTAAHGTLLGYRVFTGQETKTDGQETYGYVIYGHEPGEKTFVTYLEKVEMATGTLVAGEPLMIVAPTSVTTLRARLVSVPLAAGGRSLKVEGKTEGDAAVFTLRPTDYANGRFLRVRLDFESPGLGAVEYIWQLTSTGGSASATPTPVVSADAPPPCVRPTPIPRVTPTLVPALAFHDGTGVLPPEILASLSDLVILGTVVGPAVGLEVPGRDPVTMDIVTDTSIQVECVLKGTPTGSTVTVRVEGGCVERGDGQMDCVMVSHIRPLEIGQRQVVFLEREGPDYVTALRKDGTYEIQTRPDYYTTNGEFLVAGNRVSNGFDELPLAELMARVDSVDRPLSPDAGHAYDALIAFFDHLHDGQYQQAAELYGGSYEMLVGYNPDVDPQAHAALLKRACTVNGYQCLRPLSAALQGLVSPTAYRFSVAFSNATNDLFIPGAAEQQAQVQFVFTVQKEDDGRFLVQELPVYVP